MLEADKYLKNYTSVFIETINKDLQHWVAQRKKQKILLLLLKEVLDHVNHFLNKISPLWAFIANFHFCDDFFVLDDFIDLEIWRLIIEAHRHTFKKSSEK